MDPALAAALAAAIGAAGGNSGLTAGATLEQLQKAIVGATQLESVPGTVLKTTFVQSGSATSGLTAYDLEAPAKLLYPVLTPLRNMVPAGVRQGRHPSRLAGDHRHQHRQDFVRRVRGQPRRHHRRVDPRLHRRLPRHRLRVLATFEAQYAAENFDDVRARAATSACTP
jgi:hypothetical protein